jgi:fructose-1,6-bisphosphatase/inositol monophosphatase family enzyme
MLLNVPSSETIETLIRTVTEVEIMPRWKALSDDEQWEKRPGSIVTAADIAAEKFLCRELPPLLPGSVVVGEEMVENKPAALDLLCGDDPVWVLDPVDGTSNFARGSADFGVMVALVLKRQTIGGWIFRPVEDEMFTCELGAGAYRNGERLSILSSPRELSKMEGSLGGYLRRNTDLPDRLARVTSTRCIAVDYCALVTGDIHFAHYRGVRVWDHAPGWLLHTEAGGYNQCLDDTEYLAGKPGEGGILLATDREAWEVLRDPLEKALATFK